MKKEELVVGEIYVKKNWIFDHVDPNHYKRNNTAICITSRLFYEKNAAMKGYNDEPERVANYFERQWLLACVEAGRFIELKDLKIKSSFAYKVVL